MEIVLKILKAICVAFGLITDVYIIFIGVCTFLGYGKAEKCKCGGIKLTTSGPLNFYNKLF